MFEGSRRGIYAAPLSAPLDPGGAIQLGLRHISRQITAMAGKLKTVRVTLTPQIADLLEAEVAAGRFANLSEAIRNAAWKAFAEVRQRNCWSKQPSHQSQLDAKQPCALGPSQIRKMRCHPYFSESKRHKD